MEFHAWLPAPFPSYDVRYEPSNSRTIQRNVVLFSNSGARNNKTFQAGRGVAVATSLVVQVRNRGDRI